MKVKLYRTRYDVNRYPCIVAETGNYVCDGRKEFTSPELIADFCNEQLDLGNATEEYLYGFALDTKCHLTGLFEISHGTVDASLASPREIFQRLLLLGATSFIIVHNHPSGDPFPSKADVELTERIKQCGDLLQIGLLDHVIVADNTYYSLKEEGFCK